ncbi:MAG: RNA methyltransferase [Bdellovibrionales bacterium]
MNTPPRVAVGLVHWPVYDKAKSVVCTNVTNFDVHDIARASRTYGVEKYYVINPMKEQLAFVSRMLDFWRVGYGSSYNHMRHTALTMVDVAHSLPEALQAWDPNTKIITTSAKAQPGIESIDFKALREEMWSSGGGSYFIVFGTGFGLEESVYENTRLLEPIKGAVGGGEYRHLSVRSAVSICLDRLLGA